jgi:hypothetical protein
MPKELGIFFRVHLSSGLGVRRLVQRNAIVRKFAAIEALGNVQHISSDLPISLAASYVPHQYTRIPSFFLMLFGVFVRVAAVYCPLREQVPPHEENETETTA